MSPHGDPLAPGLLLAMPQLRDPNFHRSVVLVTEHGEDGAMGFVINRVLPATVREVVEGLDIRWNGPSDAPVWGGGPVSPQTGWVLFESEPDALPDGDVAEVAVGTYLSASVQTLRQLSARPPRSFRLLLGYAGWEAGQLESELLEGAWLTIPHDRRLLFETPPENMWARAFKLLGIEPGCIVPGEGIQ